MSKENPSWNTELKNVKIKRICQKLNKLLSKMGFFVPKKSSVLVLHQTIFKISKNQPNNHMVRGDTLDTHIDMIKKGENLGALWFLKTHVCVHPIFFKNRKKKILIFFCKFKGTTFAACWYFWMRNVYYFVPGLI